MIWEFYRKSEKKKYEEVFGFSSTKPSDWFYKKDLSKEKFATFSEKSFPETQWECYRNVIF